MPRRERQTGPSAVTHRPATSRRVGRVAAAALTLAAVIAAAAGVAVARAGAAAGRAVSHPLPNNRTYTLLAPTFISGRQPLVIVLHGANQNAAMAEQYTGMDTYADQGTAVAYGQGVGGRWNAGSCCSKTNTDDITYLRSLVADVAARTPIDLTRVYAVGFSNGAMMAWRAACQMPDLIAGAGVVAGALLVPCTTTPNIRTYHLHGINDSTVPFTGGIGFEGHTFPDSRREPTLTGPGSIVRQQLWAGSHMWPGDAGPTLMFWLLRWRLGGGTVARPQPRLPAPHPVPPRRAPAQR